MICISIPTSHNVSVFTAADMTSHNVSVFTAANMAATDAVTLPYLSEDAWQENKNS